MRETFLVDIDTAMSTSFMLGDEHSQAILMQMRRLALALPPTVPDAVQDVAGDATVVTSNLNLNETTLRSNETLYNPSVPPIVLAS